MYDISYGNISPLIHMVNFVMGELSQGATSEAIMPRDIAMEHPAGTCNEV